MNAAIEYQEEKSVDMVEVILDLSRASSGAVLPYAIARYAPDGKGMSGADNLTWEVTATGEQVEPVQIEIADLWFSNWDKPEFQLRNGLTNEKKMTAFIAKELKIKQADVHLPLFTAKDYYKR